jgi:(1->4)-alpha-D-glucan 1-alpha-D-glucosylmutase
MSHVYLSPILSAMPGSMHGYDGIDPTQISDELGGEAAYYRMTEVLESHGLGQILDVVPNHLAASPLNPWWKDVLQHGPQSRFATFFDVRWRPDGTIHLPVLGSDVITAIENGDLRIASSGEDAILIYFDVEYPLAPGSVGGQVEAINLPSNLTAVLERQHYRLVDWHESSLGMDYRRFFNINGLIGVRVEDPAVFDAMKSRIAGLVKEGHVQGIRIDHVDGLRRPAVFLRRLRESAPMARIVVEKILEGEEALPEDWPVEGTTGYDFLAAVNGLFVSPDAETDLTRLYAKLTGEDRSYETVLEESKRFVLETSLAADVSHLVGLFRETESGTVWSRDDIHLALRELIVSLPVYRTYFDSEAPSVNPADRAPLTEALCSRGVRSNVEPALIEVLSRILTCPETPAELDFQLSFQQYTGPAMAKGGEDMAFYRYNRLVSLNEVGASPGQWGASIEAFHAFCRRTAAHWPMTLLTTSTHDT